MTKKAILEKLKKTYNRATDRIFSEDCHIFNDHDFTCQLTLNPDKTLTITVKAERCSTDAQETRDNVTNPRSQECPRFQSGKELANSVGKINAC